MIKRKKCTVEDCNYPRFAKGFCNRHQYMRTDKKTLSSGLKRSPIKKRYKPTGELDVFKEIWSERPHICFCCGVNLGNVIKPIFFSHVLAKGNYGRFRLLKDNIVLCCPDCHYDWEFGDRKDSKFNNKKELYQNLVSRYYSK